MIAPRLNQSLIRAINSFERAAVDRSWKGSQPPEDWPFIKEAYWLARDRLARAITKAGHGQ